ncbi:hypothetical protein HYW58_02440 [Candidatus Kaiserbacteria bacterium]|nr:hypothetical protein [Candidatus Kaiserbacteria bacterium]
MKSEFVQKNTLHALSVLVMNKRSVIRMGFVSLALFVTHYFNIDTNIAGFLLPFFILDGADGGGGGGGSTPFLKTWNGKKFVYENDFLFGKPRSFFRNLQEGIKAYESGEITPDLYKIQNNIKLRNGNFVAQIKEIEPEESYIDHLSLLRVTYPKNGELIVDSNFKDFCVFEKSAVKKLEGVQKQGVSLNGVDVSSGGGNAKNIWERMSNADGYMLEPKKDTLEIRGFVEDKNKDAYVLLRAHIRDWTVGEIFDVSKQEHYTSASFLEVFSQISSPKVLSTVLKFIRSILDISSSLVKYWDNKTANISVLKNSPNAQQHSAYLPLPPW